MQLILHFTHLLYIFGNVDTSVDYTLDYIQYTGNSSLH
jgi:hypothetical protein